MKDEEASRSGSSSVDHRDRPRNSWSMEVRGASGEAELHWALPDHYCANPNYHIPDSNHYNPYPYNNYNNSDRNVIHQHDPPV